MSQETEEFFKGKRPWSKIKDRILGSYLNAYLAKVNRLGKEILLIDAFAGPGIFEDGSEGSPLFICNAANRYAPENYRALFINNEPHYHERLDSILKERGFFPAAQSILGDSQDLLRQLTVLLADKTVFLYLDPFGLKDCQFETLYPFLNRNPRYSTEIIINLSVPIIHRLAGREKAQEMDPQLQSERFDLLTRVLGGEYWKDAMLSEGLNAKQREELVVKGYMQKLSTNGYLKFTGACPIQATRDSATKYYMIFASPHPDARKLLNDEMLKAFNEYMNYQETKDTLFAGLSWKDWRNLKELEELVVAYVSQFPGQTRQNLWHKILQNHFFRFTESEYKKAVTAVFESGLIDSPTPRPTKRLNDNCQLYPK